MLFFIAARFNIFPASLRSVRAGRPCPRARSKFFLARLFSVLCVLPVLVSGTQGEFVLEEIAPGVYLHRGMHVSFMSEHRDDIANTGFIVGKRCVAVIDSGGSVAVGRMLHAAVRKVTELPVCYVINTHVHFDHVLGNAAFLDEGAEFVGHAELAGEMEANREFFVQQFARELGPEGADAVIAPSRPVADRLNLDLGSRVIELRAWPTAHTRTDLTVYDPATGTLWSGDLLFRERLPVFDGSLKGWLSVMQELEGSVGVGPIVPGHGTPAADWQEASAGQRGYLEALLRETREMIAAGAFLEQAFERVGRAERDRWQLFDENHGRNVSRAWSELEWE